MSDRKLPIAALVSLVSLSLACSDDYNENVSLATSLSPSSGETTESMSSDSAMSDSMSGDGDGDSGGDGDGDSGDGDGDPATASGDGDGDASGDGDGDASGDGDGDASGDGDGDASGDGDGDPLPPMCIDLDQDGYGENCEMGPDCDDDDWYNHTVDGCANCADADQDVYWVGCDQYDDAQPGVDCDDANFNVFTDEGCANCADGDNDGFWVGCDQYGDEDPGPDCDDGNPNVGIQDVDEICDGLSQNCAGEIDNVPVDEMCPPEGVNAPNVGGWACNPPAPGQDGCEIVACADQFWNLDDNIDNGCECEGTSRSQSLEACGVDDAGNLGELTEDDQLLNIPVGTIPELDNGIGGGAEDWYWFTAPEDGDGGLRPDSGSIRVDFAINQGGDYRFEVFRSCNGAAFANSLATQFGAGAPPVTEWWFFDNHAAPADMVDPGKYSDDVTWPGTVFVRVFRVQNGDTCSDYQLEVVRVAN